MARERLKPGSHSNITVAKYVEDGVKANGAKRYRKAVEGEEPTKFRAAIETKLVTSAWRKPGATRPGVRKVHCETN